MLNKVNINMKSLVENYSILKLNSNHNYKKLNYKDKNKEKI